MAQNFKRRYCLLPSSKLEYGKSNDYSNNNLESSSYKEMENKSTFNKKISIKGTPNKPKKVKESLLNTPIIIKDDKRRITVHSPLSFEECVLTQDSYYSNTNTINNFNFNEENKKFSFDFLDNENNDSSNISFFNINSNNNKKDFKKFHRYSNFNKNSKKLKNYGENNTNRNTKMSQQYQQKNNFNNSQNNNNSIKSLITDKKIKRITYSTSIKKYKKEIIFTDRNNQTRFFPLYKDSEIINKNEIFDDKFNSLNIANNEDSDNEQIEDDYKTCMEDLNKSFNILLTNSGYLNRIIIIDKNKVNFSDNSFNETFNSSDLIQL